jgi:hypothetical protein
MDDSMVGMVQPIEGDPVFFTIFGQFVYLEPGKFILDGEMLINGWDIVIGSSNRVLRTEKADSPAFDPGKGLRTGYFMDQMLVNIEYRRASFDLIHHMLIPDLVK